MLAMTDNASLVIKSIADGSELPDGSGLRIASQPEDSESLNLSMASEPIQGDEVVEGQGARIFLEPTASTMLGEMTLDAEVDDQGGVQFFLAAQGEEAADGAGPDPSQDGQQPSA